MPKTVSLSEFTEETVAGVVVGVYVSEPKLGLSVSGNYQLTLVISGQEYTISPVEVFAEGPDEEMVAAAFAEDLPESIADKIMFLTWHDGGKPSPSDPEHFVLDDTVYIELALNEGYTLADLSDFTEMTLSEV